MSDTRSARDPNVSYRAQEKAYVRRLRQEQQPEYFDGYTTGMNYDSTVEEDSEEATPSPDAIYDMDPYDQETLLFYGNDDIQITPEDLQNPANRERLEWHTMLASVLTGDVVRQEMKRLTGASDKLGVDVKEDIWVGVRAMITGRTFATQRRMIEEGRQNLPSMLEEITNFEVKGEMDTGKSAAQQIKGIVKQIEKVEGLYPSHAALVAAQKVAGSSAYVAACNSVIAWSNTTELINIQLGILQRWVGNPELDFLKPKQHTPGHDGLSDDTPFIERLLKEDGLKSLQGERSMLRGVSEVVLKAKATLIDNSEAFASRHLPPYIEELLNLISFPSRLIEQVIRMRLDYASKMKETAQQHTLMQEQMLSQFQLLLRLAIDIKKEYAEIARPEPGWDLPPCIDDSFDEVVLDLLKHYFKMLGLKLGGNKNARKEAEVLEQEWKFSNEIGRHLQGGDIEVAEQFSSLTHKALYRLSQNFERELQKKPKETAGEMDKRYKAILDSVRVRQLSLQRFSRVLSARFENATDFSISMNNESLMHFYDRLIDTGHFLVYTASFEHDGIFLLASASLWNRPAEIAAILGTFFHEEEPLDTGDRSYVLVMRPESPLQWVGRQIDANIREPNVDIKLGHLRLVARSRAKLDKARQAFIDSLDMHLDMVVEQRSNLAKVNSKLTDIKKVSYKLSNTIMDSVDVIRKQTEGLDCQELIQTCFTFAAEFGERSQAGMDRNRQHANQLKLTKLALDWISFICDDCIASDRKTFRWAVAALDFSMKMTKGSQILSLGEDEYAKLRAKVAGCMSLLISHFDIMGARSTLAAAQAEKQRMDALAGQFKKLDMRLMQDDEESAKYRREQRLEVLNQLDLFRKQKEAERQALGRVLEENSVADRSLTYLSSSATHVTMRWQQGKFVGGGTFGSVYEAINLDSGYYMAVKEIRLQDPQLIPTIAGQIRDEMGVLEVLDHPNVVSYYGIEVHRDKVYIFMEYCSGGSLAGLLDYGRIEDEQVIMVYALQLLEGLAYLHESGIVHRDIKPENILLDHSGVIKYVDFGAAKVIARQGKTLIGGSSSTAVQPNKSMTGTPMYMSPEVIKGENPGRAGAVDVWSLGCVILEMATGRRPWASLDNEWAIMYNIAQGNPPQLPSPDQLSPLGIDFLKKCFIRDPRKRASAAELLQHDWIMQIRNQVSIDPSTPSDSGSSTRGSIS